MHPYEVLKRPIITEKTQWQVGYAKPQYVFEVDPRANKQQIKEAVELAFGVKVLRVNIINMPRKRRRNPRSRIIGQKASHIQRSPQWKKAIVQVSEKDRIPLFEGVA
ncbi:MAG: 50S ribosomal protein L23 [Thermoflexales bacterium]|nr:50S ribosomal protein L23 [Thermoflexales bacterium]MCS7325600.1 50S ribosomal protein L23 [Thermoflexales bacterium]MCX7937900.1 50S ribosomal protein L23 [Thermoflexales bacterium]MDW8053819.1 50S ribosomal protein L23 [Anaerolineae bacterium]MDW8292350.1 50S ribosomal protein L23 [Anaerolineae bacterium]